MTTVVLLIRAYEALCALDDHHYGLRRGEVCRFCVLRDDVRAQFDSSPEQALHAARGGI